MSDDDVSVKFGAEIGGLESGIGQAKSSLAGFSEDVLKMNPHLAEALGGLDKAAEGAAKLSHATAGVTREFLVLGHEALTGNFSRMAGSSLVLANRMGILQNLIQGVSLASAGWVAAILATVAATYEWIAADERLQQSQEAVHGAAELNNQSLSYTNSNIEDSIYRIRMLADVNEKSASDIALSFARAGGLSVDLKNKLLSLVGDYAAATGKDAPKAAENLIKMFSDPKRGAEELARTFTGVLSPAQMQMIEKFSDSGNAMKAQEALFDALGSKIDNFRADHLTPLQKSLEGIRDSWVALVNGHFGDSLSSNVGTYMKSAKTPELSLSPDQQDAAAKQEKQNETNVALEKGFEIEQKSGALIARKNELLERQAGLIAAANAASQKGDNQDAARFKQDAAEVQEQINNLRAKGSKQDVEAEMQSIQEKLNLNKIYLGEKKDLLQAEVDAGKLTKNQELEALRTLTNQEYDLNRSALDEEIKLSGLTVVERQRVNNEILTLQAQHERDMAALTLQEAAAQEAALKKIQEEYKSFFDIIDRDMDSMLQGVLQGTQSWQQAMARLFDNLTLSFIEDVAKMMLKWAAFEASKTAFGQKDAMTTALGAAVPTSIGGGAQNSVLNAAMTKVAAALGINTAAHTASTVATSGNSVATTANTLGTSAGSLATTAGTVATTANTAGTISTGLLHIAAMAENTLATAANTIATWFEGAMASFDVGSYSVPNDMVAKIHQGEMIIPAAQAAQIRSGGASIGGSIGGGGAAGAINVNFSLNAIDTQTGIQFLKRNMPTIAAGMATAIRNGNNSFASAARN